VSPMLPIPFVEALRAPSSAPPPARPCVPPPADDRFELLRRFVLDDVQGYKTASAKLLARRAPLGDREAWEAVASDMEGPGRGYAGDVARALGNGDLDAAVREAAVVCGDLDDEKRPDGEKWLREMRANAARKGGA